MNLKNGIAGFAFQSAKGAAAADPAFAGPVGGGKLLAIEVEQVEDELTSAEIGSPGEYRESAAFSGEYESRMWPGSFGALLYAVLGAISSAAGTPAVPAVLTTALVGVNNDLTFLAKTAGVAGNDITIALVDPAGNDQPLDVTVTDDAIEVSLATGPAGAITSTATQVRNAVNADAEASALVTASLAPGNDGSGVVTALVATNLAGGAAAGGGGSSTHDITPADELPWATVFGQKGKGTTVERKAFPDCKCDSLKIEWEGNGPVKVTPAWLGCDVAWQADEFTIGTDETDLAYLMGIHSAVTLDLDGNGEDCDASVSGGTIEIKRNVTADLRSGQLEPAGIDEGGFECDVELKAKVPDLTAVRLLLTGSTGGSAIAEDVLYGDLTVAFASSPSSVILTATKVAWQTEEPESDPKGGPAEITLKGRCYGSVPLTGRVINTVASYTS